MAEHEVSPTASSTLVGGPNTDPKAGTDGASHSHILQLLSVSKTFGGISALTNVSFVMKRGEILGLIGPNGTGKTTLFNVIGGRYKPTTGRIIYAGNDITKWPAHRVARCGLVRTFQFDALFDDQTVFDNVLIACQASTSQASLLRCLVGGRAERRNRHDAEARALEGLDRVGLAHVRDMKCAQLSHGQKRLLGIAVALGAKPRLLLLDEPLSGLSDQEIDRVLRLCAEIRDSGISVLLVEHNVEAVMGLCHRVVVLNFGKVLTEGNPADVRLNPLVIDAYLGDSKGTSSAIAIVPEAKARTREDLNKSSCGRSDH